MSDTTTGGGDAGGGAGPASHTPALTGGPARSAVKATPASAMPPAEAVGGVGVDPPWANRTSPVEADYDKADREERKLRDSASGTEYTFLGHRDRYNDTEFLKTEHGTVRRGESIPLTDELFERLKASGFRFRKSDGGKE